MESKYGTRPGLGEVSAPLCVHCHKPIGPDDATDETGMLHFEPCAGEAAAVLEDMLVDRARERIMFAEWGSRS